jgi:hypothetical protein
MANPAPTTPFTIAALTSEINTDPTNVGYAAVKSAGRQAILNLLTSLTANPGAGPVWRTKIPAIQVIQTIVPADFLALTAIQLQQMALLGLSAESTVTFDATNTNMNTIFGSIFAGKTTTLAAFTAMAQQTGGRNQVLWGIDNVVTVDQLQQAGI